MHSIVSMKQKTVNMTCAQLSNEQWRTTDEWRTRLWALGVW